ncbi:MAG: ornithine aminomutase subunit alpha [Deltaproteobacteria bacterium]|uniref:Ornithine aminomutase subunit alpha n=1 Tax=Candidatus Zymogenus saltonus TaxID=2844893 RepID=A0A9D8KFV5_9DELT|nr:ornithine aminomutase subunit alpha [Candidatus Zymogenus saltonus]
MERGDDYEQRRERLKGLSDEELKDRFWELLNKIVEPIVEEARTHTSPSIERSVLLRMGFSSIEAKGLVTNISERGLLGCGAGGIVYRVAQKNKVDVRSAGLGLIEGKYWEDIDP